MIASIGSTAPLAVLPRLDTTQNGSRPFTRSASIISSRASTSMRRSAVVGTARSRHGGRPITAAAFATDMWAWWLW